MKGGISLDEIYSSEQNYENLENDKNEFPTEEVKDAKQKKTSKKIFKAKIINRSAKYIDIDFKGFGIRIYSNSDTDGDFINIEYESDIGKPDFKYKIRGR